MSYNPLISTYDKRFKMYVAWVDHNSTIADEQQEGTIAAISPQTGRNMHIGGFKMSQNNPGIAYNVLVPQEVIGSFKLPQIGDVVWIEETRRSNDQTPIYRFSSYSNDNPAPIWGSMHGDYGHLRSHRDHTDQFDPKTEDADFRTKFIRSITGYRFRSFYRSNLEQGKFVVRGDAVFDIEPAENNRPYLINTGSALIEGGSVETDKGKYPEPLNVPKEREKDEAYMYGNIVYTPLDTPLSPDDYDLTPKTSRTPTRAYKTTLKTKNYLAYQPVMDKPYLDSVSFEREIAAAEEYQVALRGNNKLLIQDQYGDGEQLVITLKSQYDEQFTIVHNGERGQIRVRDHLGQGVLLDADPEAPRVLSWTANKQVIEQGGVKGKGEFTYIRNGSAFGDSQTSFGTKTGVTKNDVPNQEVLMVSTPDIIGELGSRLSAGMNTLVNGAMSPGIYFRNNTDGNPTNQTFSLYSKDEVLVTSVAQETGGYNGVVETSTWTQALTGAEAVQTIHLEHIAPGAPHAYTETISTSGSEYNKVSVGELVGSDTITTTENITIDNTAKVTKSVLAKNLNEIITTEDSSIPLSSTVVNLAGAPLHSITQDVSGVSVKRLASGLTLPIVIGDDGGSGLITLGDANSDIAVTGKGITIKGTTVDVDNA